MTSITVAVTITPVLKFPLSALFFMGVTLIRAILNAFIVAELDFQTAIIIYLTGAK